MSEHSPTSNPDPEQAIRDKFEHLSNNALIARMERAEDFNYDDESRELDRRLKLGGLAWRWSGDFFHPKVEVYQPEENQR